jgi:hypothetical protein
MNIRPVAGFLTGFVLWWFLFLAVGIGFGLLWPAYREAARVLFSEGDFSLFTTAMQLMNFLVFMIVGICVGLLASIISRSRTPVLVLALFYFLYAAVNHFYLEWDTFPAWYNVIVPFIISGSIVLGSRFIRPPGRRAR